MMDNHINISKAGEADLNGILELQAANQIDQGGALSASLPRTRIVAMMQDMPLIVARRDGIVTGFLMTTTRTMNADLPLVQAMFAAHPGTENAYFYGPICVDEQERGKGLAQLMFKELRRLQPGREGILFIRRDNQASLNAHARMGIDEVGEFQFKGSDFAVLSYIG